ncbi:MAG TPA: xanthine dehydrogenase family protein molybdopterin-binding subunit [Candidatus Binatia bacterium]|nr:xanthine dehydrogenase family protein molybdopterin-binding subunit [Candidatus Binatia bacterium]
MTKFIGARVKRIEDPRFLRGETSYVEGMQLPRMLHVAYVRSPHAHARLRGIDARAALALPGVRRVFTGAELADVLRPLGLPFRADVFPPAVYKCPKWPALAVGKARYVGEAVAAVVAESRYLAEDGAELVEVDWEPLGAVVEPEDAIAPGAPLVHEELGTNLTLDVSGSGGDVERAFRDAALVVRERFRTNRHHAVPMEGRATLAAVDPDGNVTIWTSSQMPHFVRTRIADLMGYPEQKIRVVSPDVGGGFGLKNYVIAEEVLACHFARVLRAPVKWVEDRREHLLNAYHSRDAIADVEMAFAADGTLLGARMDVLGDSGAYSTDPWPSTFEPLQLALALPGPYKLRNYAWHVRAACTNKAAIGTYRGVGLPGAAWMHEQMMELAAQRLRMDPADLRRKNMIRPDEFPYTTVNGLEYDSGSSSDAMDKALAMADYRGFRARQAAARRQGRYLGIGIGNYIEMTTFGSRFLAPMGVEHGAYEAASVRFNPNGGVELCVGTHSHGQGHHTTYAQMVADQIGVDPADVRFLQGDTQGTPYGWGTWGSRSVVSGGGAVIGAARKVREKILRVAAHLLEVSPGDLDIVDGQVRVRGVPGRAVSVREVARAAVFAPWKLPPGEDPGLEAVQYYDPPPVVYSNATHVAEVEVDVESGAIAIRRFVVVEDCGTVINPTIVAGQVVGGVAAGIGTALLEHLVYDESGQLVTTSFMDYLTPTAAVVPPVELDHIETPSPLSVIGMKGTGEGGAIGAPAALAAAVADALAPFGAKVTSLPLAPERVWRLAHPRDAFSG